mgnify:CR=1 FL=1
MIDTQAIRKKILDLALRGKLTEQRPEDGTAEELFQQIQAQKNTYIANKDTKKANVSVPISDDEVPFNKPESWKWVRLGEIVIIKTGKRDANFGSINGKYEFFTCAKEPIKCNSFSFSGEALLLAGNGDIGNISYYYGEFEAYQRTYVLQPYLENVYLRYLYYYLLSYWVQYNLAQMFGATIPFIRLGNVQNYIIALPPIAEQHRIVSKIESIFCILDTIDTLQSQYQDNLATLKSKIIDAGIQGKLTEQLPEDGNAEELYQQIQREKLALEKAGKIKKSKPLPPISDEEKPFDLPDNWRWVSVGDACTNIQYGTSKKSSETGKVPVIRMGNLQGGRIVYDKLAYTSDDSEIEKYPLEVNDLLFNRTNSMELVGKTAIYKGEMPAIYAGYLVRVTPVLMVSDYLNYVMQTKYYWDYCRMVRIDANG